MHIILRRQPLFDYAMEFKTYMNGGECKMSVDELSLVAI